MTAGRRFPFPIPFGWFQVAFPSDLAPGEVTPLEYWNRELVLWMLKPSKYPSGYGASDLYACPDQTRGSYYSSPSRVSLLNSATRKIINTVNLAGANENGEDSVDLPYAIRKGYYYVFDGRESFAKKPEVSFK